MSGTKWPSECIDPTLILQGVSISGTRGLGKGIMGLAQIVWLSLQGSLLLTFGDPIGLHPFQCAPPGYFDDFRSVQDWKNPWSLISFPTVATDLPVLKDPRIINYPCHLGSMSQCYPRNREASIFFIKAYSKNITLTRASRIQVPQAPQCYCMANLNYPVSSTDGSQSTHPQQPFTRWFTFANFI